MSSYALNRNYNLQLPNSFVEIDREEMEYVDGGYQVAMEYALTKQSNCFMLAKVIIANGSVTGMSALEIAQELYAHAICYYFADKVRGLPGTDWIIEHANPIDLENGGDSWWRKKIYTTIWAK